MTALPITAIVLTRDEEQLLPRCLSGLTWADEVLVVDSESTDRTREVAAAAGARVLEQPWLGWSGQRNVGAAAARNDWVFFVEADELVTAELEASLRRTFATPPDPSDGFAIDRRDEFMGRLMPQAQRASTVRTFIRLYNRTRSGWDPEMLVHERVLVPGRRRVLEGTMSHWRRQSLTEQAERVVRYSDIEARAFDAVHPSPSLRHLVAQPVARFVWLYLARGGIRHGRRGLIHAGLRATADFLRHARHYEMHLGETPLHPPHYRPTAPSGVSTRTPAGVATEGPDA